MESIQGFIRQRQILSLVCFSAPTLWRKINAGTFPKPVKLGQNITAWRMEEVHAWMEAQK